MSDVSELESAANALKDFSISMTKVNMNTSHDAMGITGPTKTANAFMNQPDKINAPQ